MDSEDLLVALEAVADGEVIAGEGPGDFDGSPGAEVEGKTIGAGAEEEGIAVG
jgi:hypothetical protein